MMTTWRDYLLNKAFTHTWMVYIPGLPLDLDYPEVLGLRVPLPTLVLNDEDDSSRWPRCTGPIASWPRSTPRRRRGALYASFYPGPHKFDRPMQEEAFAWFDRWLKA